MPVDFLRVPPRVDVPHVSRPSILVWTLLLGLMVTGCVALAVFVWPARNADSVVFWFCAIGFPILAWSFLLCCRLAYLYGCLSAALATNKISDAIEAQCHESSSQPLAVLGNVWKFSSNEEENSLDALVDGMTKLRPVASQAVPNTDVIARWLDVPGRQFYSGNARTEHARQSELCEWLLNEMVDDIKSKLIRIPHQVSLGVDVCINSVIDSATVQEGLLARLRNVLHTTRIEVKSSKTELSLFHADSWFDNNRSDSVHLLVAVQLRNAASEILANGVSEGASMLLVSSPAIASRMGVSSPLCLHRPARGPSETTADVLKLAIRWGGGTFDNIGTSWRTGLSKEVARIIRSSCRFWHGMETVDLDAAVGKAGAAGVWLATALAAANAALTNEPQLVITQEGNDLLALVCEKQT